MDKAFFPQERVINRVFNGDNGDNGHPHKRSRPAMMYAENDGLDVILDSQEYLGSEGELFTPPTQLVSPATTCTNPSPQTTPPSTVMLAQPSPANPSPTSPYQSRLFPMSPAGKYPRERSYE